jgi:hypothetical protein
VFIAIIGHGLSPKQQNHGTGEFIHLLVGPTDAPVALRASELGYLLGKITAKNVIVALHPCFSGGFLEKLKGAAEQVIITSTAADEGNSFGWIESFTRAVSLRGPKQGFSFKRVWEQTTPEAADECGRCGQRIEHPQLDNSQVAERRYLGDNGMPLEYTKNALKLLRKKKTRTYTLFVRRSSNERSGWQTCCTAPPAGAPANRPPTGQGARQGR